uniref:Serpentine receptor class gamma n=1 Tax=Panagrellus redivivus TaxID=6233 RepID=A0A7E4US15_PANRE
MERLGYIQAVAVLIFAIIPYAAELYVMVVFVLTLSPMALAISTLCAVKPYQLMMIGMVNMFRFKAKPNTIRVQSQSRVLTSTTF